MTSHLKILNIHGLYGLQYLEETCNKSKLCWKSDVLSLVKSNLKLPRPIIISAAGRRSNSITKMHLDDLADRINNAFEPN